MKFSINYRIGLGFVLLVLITAGVISSLFYARTTDILVDNALREIEKDVFEAGNMLKRIVSTRDEDVLFLASTPPIQGMLRTRSSGRADKDGSTYIQWKNRLSTIFESQLKRKAAYISIRYIDHRGIEIAHSQRKGDRIIHIKAEELQDKSKREYVLKTTGLPAGQVYVSEINLNREYGKIVRPFQPVIRSATAVYDERTRKYAGMVVITADIQKELIGIKKHIRGQHHSSVYITNDQGGYLFHPDKNKEFGFDVGKRYRVQEDIPQVAHLFVPGFEQDKVILLPWEVDNQNVIHFSKIKFDDAHPERFIAVVIRQNYKSIVQAQSGLMEGVIGWSALLVLFAMISGLLYARRISRPIKNITSQMDDYANKRISSVTVDTSHHDELGSMAKSFQSMIEEVESVKGSLEDTVKERTFELNRFKTTLDETLDCVFMFAPDTCQFFYVNAGAINQVGYSYEDLLKMRAFDIKPEYDERAFREMIAPMIAGEMETVSFETVHQHKDGHTIPVEIFLQYIHPENEEPRFVAIVRDITERKLMDKMKNEFISTVSHELRTPLTSIRGSLGLITGGTVGEIPPSALEMLKIASNNTERLLLLINDILDIQKIESGKMNFDFQRLELMPFLQQAIIDHAEYGSQFNVSFEIGRSLDDAHVFVDKDRLMQVMGNLLSNAAKFSNEGDNVKISVSRHHDDRIRIGVTDYGAGIPEEFQPKLFDKFTQSDSSDTRAKGGTGLGLSISKAIIEKHGGTIDFISKENVGTTFFVELPEISGDTGIDSNEVRTLPDEHLPCVLIVEDEPDVAALIRRMLAEAGINSDVAATAEEAKKLLEENGDCYRLMTLDIMLPGEDGISLLNSVRKNKNTSSLPVVVLSVKADEARRELNGGAVGVVDWLSKPIDQDRLVQVINGVVKEKDKPKILHVEDEADVHRIVQHMVEEHCDLLWSRNLDESRKLLESEDIDLVLLDIGLPDGSGLDLIEDIEKHVMPPRIVIFSANEVPEEVLDKVETVLVKSRTSNDRLLEVLLGSMR